MNTNVFHRLRARAALKGNWGIALLAALIANAPTLLMQVVFTRVSGGWTERLLTAYYTSGDAFEREAAQLNGQLTAALPALLASVAVALILGPALSVGMKAYSLALLRKEEPGVTAVFRRLPILLKCLGMTALIFLRCLLWSLPGAGLMLLVLLIPSFPVRLASFTVSASTILMVVLALRAYLRCSMAPWMLADDPGHRVLLSVRRSREIMRGRTAQLAMLLISFYWMLFLLNLVLNLFLSGLPVVLSMTIGMAAELAIDVYMLSAEGSFYEEAVLGRQVAVNGTVG